MRSAFLLSLAVSTIPVLAEKNHFYSGFFANSTVVGVEFNDESSSLTIVNNIPTNVTSGQKWITVDCRKKNLYVATTGYFHNYSITDDLSLSYESNITIPSSSSTQTSSQCPPLLPTQSSASSTAAAIPPSPYYVSASSLSASGAIIEQLFLMPTTKSGGSTNAVSPAGFSEQFFGIAVGLSNFLEVWTIIEDDNGTTAEAVAHLELEQEPANVMWYS